MAAGNQIEVDRLIALNNRNLRRYLQALQDEVEVYVMFVNTTQRTVDLFWVRERETEPETVNMQYTLKPFEEVRVNTYSTHTWFFRDYYTGERMHVRSQRVFCPVRIRVPRDPQRPLEDLRDVRSQVLIHFPLRSLKDNCLWLIVKWLKRTVNEPRRYINGYMIPATLKQQLLVVLRTLESYSRPVPAARLRR